MWSLTERMKPTLDQKLFGFVNGHGEWPKVEFDQNWSEYKSVNHQFYYFLCLGFITSLYFVHLLNAILVIYFRSFEFFLLWPANFDQMTPLPENWPKQVLVFYSLPSNQRTTILNANNCIITE